MSCIVNFLVSPTEDALFHCMGCAVNKSISLSLFTLDNRSLGYANARDMQTAKSNLVNLLVLIFVALHV